MLRYLRLASIALGSLGLLTVADRAAAEPISLVCGGTQHLLVDIAASTVKVGELSPVQAVVTDQTVSFTFFYPVWNDYGKTIYASLNRYDLTLYESNPEGSAPDGIRWGANHSSVKCVMGDRQL
jgi:hypothetical protein